MKKAFYGTALFVACFSTAWGQSSDTSASAHDTAAIIKRDTSAKISHDTVAVSNRETYSVTTHDSAFRPTGDSVAVVSRDSAILTTIGTIRINSIDTSHLPVVNVVQAGNLSMPVRPGMDEKYGTLLNDDPAYNPRYPLWQPVVRVAIANATLWGIDRYVFNYDWSRIGPSTWRHNIEKGWEWDNDRFGVNFIGHPYSGNMYFNIARSHGYNFWQSFPFAVGGSLMWEYFGENSRPSINDIINTPVSGAFLGEVLYRVCYVKGLVISVKVKVET